MGPFGSTTYLVPPRMVPAPAPVPVPVPFPYEGIACDDLPEHDQE